MARLTNDQLHVRGQVAFYASEGTQKLTAQSLRWLLTKDDSVEGFILKLAEEVPSKMRKLFKAGSEIVEAANKRSNEENSKEKSTAEAKHMHGRAKRAKIDLDNPYAEHLLDKCCAATGLPNCCDEVNGLQDTASEIMSQFECPIEETDTMIVPSEVEIELGLTRGTETIQIFVSRRFFEQNPLYKAHSKSELSPIFKAFMKLDFTPSRAQLAEYLKVCLVRASPDADLAPMTFEMDDPHEIFDGLMDIEITNFDALVRQAYGRMRLFKVVNDRTAERPGCTRHKMVEELALERAGSVRKELKDQQVNKYKREYNMGRHWLDVAKMFEGTGVVLVFVVAGIGGYDVSRGWLGIHRHFLEFAAPYLPSIRALVRSLGEHGLRQYCCTGCLSEDYIRAVEEVEPCAVEDSTSEHSDEDSD